MQYLKTDRPCLAGGGDPSRQARRAPLGTGWLLALVAPFTAIGIQGVAYADGAARTAAFKALVDRQVRAWVKGDFSIAAGDWADEGELRSPGGRAPKSELQAAMTDYFKSFKDLEVVVTQVFVSTDSRKAAIEWDWNVTRIRDGKRGNTHDAIIVDLERGKIKSWREYFDFGNSVDAHP